MFRVVEIRDVVFQGEIPDWAKDGIMAGVPYNLGLIHLFGRAFTNAEPVTRSSLFIADGFNPFEFTMREQPVLTPGEEGSDSELGCEDPTLVLIPGRPELSLLYTQVRSKEGGVYASLGYAYGSPPLGIRTKLLEPTAQTWWHRPLDMCKEAEILLRPNRENDVIFFEFDEGQASRVAVGKTNISKVGEVPRVWGCGLWIEPRLGKWDSDHVSTGPIVSYGNKKLMFYNGRDANRVWAIGQLVFDPQTLEIEYRSEEPLILPPNPTEIGWGDQVIAFSSGAMVLGDTVYLYHHIADRRICCAILKAD